ncbi:Predicted dehydrogenase [Pseudoxanthomonas sp. GM95]|uniref:NAD-dependent epimerase/dehydratase family protein n=1 Tax=Pseudoxanthomonas sp. GM95 TaxID=1881043 RepID=UPI0008CD4E9B|nr:NAD-dependent epimerase/dehydratase family protein [Pseudoxanthomonas sp. GM95]SEL09275.1 Predicted dehydrogenase [Pseudoxanthomonas sp. GM95]
MNTSNKTVRIGVIGAGYVARHHLAALRRLAFVEIVGICDLDAKAAHALASEFDIPLVAPTLGELVAKQRPDAVYVLTPPASHCPLTLQALELGCHVFVEKPMAESVAECDAMIESARAKGLVLSVDHSDLFDPVILRTRELVERGAVGQTLAADIVRSSDYPSYAGGPLPAMVRQGSYPFRDLGVHGLYVLEALLGPISRLDVDYRATGSQPNLQFDEWHATATCARGTGRMLLSWNARPMQNRLIVHGTRGSVEADRFLQTCRQQRVLPGPKFIGIVLGAFVLALRDVFRIPWNVLRFATGRLRPSPGIQRGAEEFARALQEGRSPPISAEDGRCPIALMEAACARADAERTAELEARLMPLEPADALVTGANGFLGRRLVAALRARGQRVRVLVRAPSAALEAMRDLQVLIGDLGDPRIVDHAVAGVGTVYHVGAAMRGDLRAFEAGTVWGTRNIIEACNRHATGKLVYVSSLSVLDHAGRDPAVPVTEASAYEPRPQDRGAYTQTKLAAESMVLEAVAARQLSAVVVRPGQIVGPGAEQVTPNGTLAIAGLWIAVGARSQTLPLVYVDDVVDGLLLAAEASAANGRIFNLVDPNTVTQGAYLDLVKAKLGRRLRLVRLPAFAFLALAAGVELLGKLLGRGVPLTRYRARSLRPLANFDIAAARTGLSWQPRVGLRRGLETMFANHAAPQMDALPDRVDA